MSESQTNFQSNSTSDWFSNIKPLDVFRGLESLSSIVSPLIPGIGQTVSRGLGQAFGLIADLLDHGVDPIDKITEVRSSLKLFLKNKQALQSYLESLASESNPNSISNPTSNPK